MVWERYSIRNMRDLGGVSTAAGKLRRGRLLRSSGLSHLSAHEVNQIPSLMEPGVYVDLRSNQEIEAYGRPEGLIRNGWKWLPVPILDKYKNEPHSWSRWPHERFEAHLTDYLVAVQAASATLKRGKVLIACSAGIDRTGIIVALILESLGVPRNQILKDYRRSVPPETDVRPVGAPDRASPERAAAAVNRILNELDISSEMIAEAKQSDSGLGRGSEFSVPYSEIGTPDRLSRNFAWEQLLDIVYSAGPKGVKLSGFRVAFESTILPSSEFWQAESELLAQKMVVVDKPASDDVESWVWRIA